MKFLIILVLTISSAFANETIKETWTCKNKVSEFTATFNPKSYSVEYDGIKAKLGGLKSADVLQGMLVMDLVASQEDRDSYHHRITLIRDNGDGYENINYGHELPKTEKKKGEAVVISESTVDCVGTHAGHTSYKCSILVERN